MNERETNCEKEYELATWAKIAIYCIKGGIVTLSVGLACLGFGIFSNPVVREKKTEGN